MILRYHFQTGPHDWETFEYDADDMEIIDLIADRYSDAEIARLYIDEIYNPEPETQESFKEIDINSAEELFDYMQDDGLSATSFAIDELIETCGVDIFDKIDLKDYFYEEAYDIFTSDPWPGAGSAFHDE